MVHRIPPGRLLLDVFKAMPREDGLTTTEIVKYHSRKYDMPKAQSLIYVQKAIKAAMHTGFLHRCHKRYKLGLKAEKRRRSHHQVTEGDMDDMDGEMDYDGPDIEVTYNRKRSDGDEDSDANEANEGEGADTHGSDEYGTRRREETQPSSAEDGSCQKHQHDGSGNSRNDNNGNNNNNNNSNTPNSKTNETYHSSGESNKSDSEDYEARPRRRRKRRRTLAYSEDVCGRRRRRNRPSSRRSTRPRRRRN